VIAEPGAGVPALASLADGRIVVGYARRGRYWVRTGTVAGELSAPVEVGSLGGNFRSGSVALAQDGAIAAAWQSGTYSSPWRLRAAVRPAGAIRFARARQLGFAAADRGTLYEGPAAALRVAGGRATVAFFAPAATTSSPRRAMCALAGAAGRFGPPRQFSTHRPIDDMGAAVVLGREVSAAMMLALPDPHAPGRTRLDVGSGCHASSTRILSAAAAHPVKAIVDENDRLWVLSQSQPTVDSRAPVMLTVTR
jgi:hypothetical protein